MPVANLQILAGHPRPQLQAWIREVSQAMSSILEAPADRLEVWVTENDPELWGIAGAPASEVLRQRPRRDCEMPFIRMVLLAGRPTSQHHRLIAELTEITGRVLEVDPQRIRMQIDEVHPDRWGIGGQPASVRRAAELAARQQGGG